MPGEVACLLGPSGSGKSTFLRCVNHLEKIDGGRLSVNGSLVGYRQKGAKLYELKRLRGRSASAPRLGMVFQRFNLFPHMTALRERHRGPDAGARPVARARPTRAAAALLAAGRRLVDKRRLPVAALGRRSSSASRSPARWRWTRSVMLFDEPTSALDPELVGEVLRRDARPGAEAA